MTEVEFIIYVKDQRKSKWFYENILKISPSLNFPGMTEFKLADSVKLGIMPENGTPRCELYLKVENPTKYITRGIELGGRN